MARMLGRDKRIQHADCHYGRNCCPTSFNLIPKKVQRRIVKKKDRQSWKRNIFDQ